MKMKEVLIVLTQYFECMKDLPPIVLKLWAKKLQGLSESQLDQLLENAVELPRNAQITPGKLRSLAIDQSEILKAWKNTLESLDSGDIHNLSELSFSVCKELRLIERWKLIEVWEVQKLKKLFFEESKDFLLKEKAYHPMPKVALPPPKFEPMSNEEFKAKKKAFLEEMKAKKNAEKLAKIRAMMESVGN